MVGWGLGAVWVWGWVLVGEGVQQGPRGGPRQRSQGVLVGSPTGAVIIIQRQVD